MMKWILNGSAVLIAGIVLFVALTMTQGLVEERSEYAMQAQDEVARAADRSDTITTPYLVLNIKELETSTGSETKTSYENEVEFTLPWIPSRVEIKDDAKVEKRERSIYPVFVSTHRLDVQLNVQIPQGFELKPNQVVSSIHWVWPMHNISSVRGEISLRKGDTQINFSEPCGEGLCAKILNADLASVVGQWTSHLDVGSAHQFKVQAKTIALKQISISNWPHVSFLGKSLPSQREISAKGFHASYENASGVRSNFLQAPNFSLEEKKFYWDELNAATVSTHYAVMSPVSTYSLTDRATKYGYLFIMLVLGAMFFVQMDTASHPLAYGLVGPSVVLFFVMLLAFAEHVHFGVAYAVATGACLGANTYYLTGIFESWKKISGILGLLGSFFGALYVILQSEDSALLIGSVFMFGCLLLAMSVSRRKSLQVNFIGGNREQA